MILAARLEIDALVAPAHRPVDLPTQFAVGFGQEIEVTAVTAAAGIVCLGAVVAQFSDGGKVGLTFGAENDGRVVGGLFGVVLGFQFLGRLVGILGFKGVQNLEDFLALLQCLDDIVTVGAAAVEFCLVTAVQLDAELGHGSQKLFLKVFGVVFVAAPGVGNVDVGTADVFVVSVADNGLHVGRNFAATVVFVPGEQETCLFAGALQGLDDEQGGGNVTEVADVDGAGRADAGGTDVFFFVRIAGDDLLRNFF